MKRILMIGLMIFAIISCKNNGLGPALGGTVILNLEDTVTQRSILPSESMDIATYDIYGTHEDSSITFEELDVTGTITIESLETGEWTIQVDGKNALGSIIGTGSNTVTITPTSQSQVTVTIVPIVGQGTLNLDIDWSVDADNQMDSPIVNSQLFAYSGTIQDLTYSVDLVTRTANYSGLQDQGYYTLLTQFVDDVDNGDGTATQTVVAGNAEIVRIAAGDTSNGAYSYDSINTGALGDVDIVISPELGDPLIIVLTPNVDGIEYSYGDTFTMDATTSSTTDVVDYTWYVNGVEYQTGPTLTYDTTDFPRPKKNQTLFSNISVIGFSNAGIRGGSTSINITTIK